MPFNLSEKPEGDNDCSRPLELGIYLNPEHVNQNSPVSESYGYEAMSSAKQGAEGGAQTKKGGNRCPLTSF